MSEHSFPLFSPIPRATEEALPREPEMSLAGPPVSAAPVRNPRTELAHLVTGLGLAALYGLSLGARTGGLSLVHHALSASAGLLAVGVLGVPSLLDRKSVV